MPRSMATRPGLQDSSGIENAFSIPTHFLAKSTDLDLRQKLRLHRFNRRQLPAVRIQWPRVSDDRTVNLYGVCISSISQGGQQHGMPQGAENERVIRFQFTGCLQDCIGTAKAQLRIPKHFRACFKRVPVVILPVPVSGQDDLRAGHGRVKVAAEYLFHDSLLTYFVVVYFENGFNTRSPTPVHSLLLSGPDLLDCDAGRAGSQPGRNILAGEPGESRSRRKQRQPYTADQLSS
jgi:hypothetical protein